MDPGTAILLMTLAALFGIGATVFIVGRRGREARQSAESPFAASSEGMTTCRRCGRGNLATDDACLYCSAPLPHQGDVG